MDDSHGRVGITCHTVAPAQYASTPFNRLIIHASCYSPVQKWCRASKWNTGDTGNTIRPHAAIVYSGTISTQDRTVVKTQTLMRTKMLTQFLSLTLTILTRKQDNDN